MATRTISTKLAIEGESEWRATLSSINSTLKAQASELKLVEAQYQTSANSMAALTAKGEALNTLYKTQQDKVTALKSALENAQAAEKKWVDEKERLKNEIAENNKKLEELRKTTGDTSEEEKKLTDANKELNSQLDVCEAKITAAGKGVDSWQTQLNNAQIKLYDYDAQLKLNNEYLDEAKNSHDECATSIDRFGNRVEEGTNSVTELKDALAAAGLIAALKTLADMMESCVTSSTAFESAMAGVKRTVGGTDEFIGEMGDHFKELSTQIPITTSELGNIATTAGQLGVARDRVEGFTVVMAKLATTTDLTADNAATLLAQFSNITGVTDYERLGSTVADLGDATATTASKVVEMSKGMAAAASVAGASATDVLGISAAVGSLGIEAMAGSTAMSTLFTNLQKAVETGKKLEGFASVAGMSARDFKKAWGEDAAGALTAFIEGLSDTERNGKSAIVVLNELGITNQRQTKAILGLSEAGDLLSRTIRQSSNAWEANTALSDKAAIMYGTTEAKLTMLSNAADNAKIAVGDKLTPAIGKLADIGTGALDWATGLLENSGALVPVLGSLATGLGVVAVGATVAAFATSKLGKAIIETTVAAAANPWLLAAGAVAALGTAIFAMAMNADDGIPSVKELTSAARDLHGALNDNSGFSDDLAHIEATSSVANGYIDTLKRLESQGELTTAQQTLWHDTLVMLVQTVPELSEYIDIQNGKIDGGTAALERHVSALEADAKAEAYKERMTEIYAKRAEAEIEIAENTIKLEKATEAYGERQKELNELLERGEISFDDYNTQLDVAHGEVEVYEKAVKKGTDALDEYNENVGDTEEALKRLAGITDDATEAIDNNTDATNSNGDAHDAASGAISSTAGMLSDLAVAYDEAKASAEESIEKQIGLFDEFSVKASSDMDTIAEMQKRWAEQTESLAQYTENLQKAAIYGIDEGLVKSLSDGSAESAGYLAAIIKDIEEAGGSTEGLSDAAQETVDSFNQSFADRKQAMEDFSETAAALETDFQGVVEVIGQAAADADFSGVTTAIDEAFDTAFANVGKKSEEVGKTFPAGLAQGITDGASAVAEAASSAAEGGTKAVESTWDSHSPSRVGEGLGRNFDLGIAQGITQETKSIIEAAKTAAKELENSTKSAAQNAVKSFDAEFKPIDAKTQATLKSLKTNATRTMSSLPNAMYSVGQESVNGMIRGINNRSGPLYRTMTSVVNTAIARARSAAATASPSKKTTKIFEDVGEGMVVGLEHKKQKVADTAQGVVDNALHLDTSGMIAAMRTTINERMPTVRTRESSISPRDIAEAVRDALKDLNTKNGDTYVTINSPERMSEREAAREFRRVQRDLTLGYG